MEVTSIAPFFVLNFVFFITAKFIVKRIDFFKQAVGKSAQAKYQTLDGFRGFLALSVFFCHFVGSYYYFQTGNWGFPPSKFYTFLGQGAVSFFFMITGFLFWSKAIANGKFNIKKFYIGRILRIYPVYLFSFFIILFVVLLASDFSLKVSLLDLFQQILRWATCGILTFSWFREIYPYSILPSINQVNAPLINAGVAWSLVYELQFYLILPLLAIFAKPLRFFTLFASILILNKVIPGTHRSISVSIIFLFGMTAAHLLSEFQLSKLLSHWKFSLGAIILLVTIPTIFSGSYFYSVKVLSLMFIVFLILLYGNSLFGLLTAAPSRYLGIVSYDIYLLHGIVLFIILRSVNKFYPIKEMNPIIYWLVIGLCGVIVIFISGITHRFVEYPYMQVKPSSGSLPKSANAEK